MGIQLYRRHTAKCAQRRPRHQLTFESDERRRAFKRCSCPIHAEGTLDRFSRKGTGKTSWHEAKAVAAVWEAANSWDAPVLLSLVPETGEAEAVSPSGVTVDVAIKAFLAECESRKIAESTLNKYRTFAKHLGEFARGRGRVYLEQFDRDTATAFRASWKDGVRSAAKKLERMKAFFAFCVDRGWIENSPAAKLKPPVGASKAANKTPFTDAELERIFAACRQLPPQKWRNGVAEGTWTGEDVITFIMLLVYTGLRISDAATFSMRRVSGNEVFLFQHKTGKPLSTWVPEEFLRRLRSMPLVNGEFPFLGPVSARKETAADLWRRKLNRVFELCGRWNEPPTPHRFRHTFARILLQRGVSPADVAELMGDTEAVVNKHYSAWVPERQARVAGIMKRVWTENSSLFGEQNADSASA